MIALKKGSFGKEHMTWMNPSKIEFEEMLNKRLARGHFGPAMRCALSRVRTSTSAPLIAFFDLLDNVVQIHLLLQGPLHVSLKFGLPVEPTSNICVLITSAKASDYFVNVTIIGEDVQN